MNYFVTLQCLLVVSCNVQRESVRVYLQGEGFEVYSPSDAVHPVLLKLGWSG